MRLFVALDIPDDVRERIAGFVESVRGFAPAARWVRPQSLHITLKFIGTQSGEGVTRITQALRSVWRENLSIRFAEFGFFPRAKAPRVFWIGIEGGPELLRLAQGVEDALAELRIPKEQHEFRPHLTLARSGGSGSPQWRKGDGLNDNFEKLRLELQSISAPQFGSMIAREFFLYQSQPGPGGSRYTKLAGFGVEQGLT